MIFPVINNAAVQFRRVLNNKISLTDIIEPPFNLYFAASLFEVGDNQVGVIVEMSRVGGAGKKTVGMVQLVAAVVVIRYFAVRLGHVVVFAVLSVSNSDTAILYNKDAKKTMFFTIVQRYNEGKAGIRR